jgi:hypothetical protein|tara:strand:- start:2356 stop:2907 length:552 start_codon:yes stop_codon:yes gene_type:complete
MYGMINKAIKMLVTREAGEEIWELVLEASGIDEDVYEDLESYDDSVTFSLVGAVSETLDIPAGDVLEMFGVYWATDVAPKSYGEYFNAFGDDFQSFVSGLDEMHVRISEMLPSLSPPSFEIEELGENHFKIHYKSPREGLAPLAIGTLKGIAQHFGGEADIIQIEYKGTDDHDIFDVQFRENV